MKNYYKKYGIPITIITSLFLLILIFYEKNKLYTNYHELVKKERRINKYFNEKSGIEGEYIWDLNLVEKDRIIKMLDGYKIVIWYDSIGCPKCYTFHRNRIHQIGMKNVIVLYNGQYQFMKKDFIKSQFLIAHNKNSKYKQIIMLINKDGIILYSDLLKYQLFGYSNLFYNIVEKYLK